MSRKPQVFSYTLADLSRMTGLSMNSVYQHKTRGGFDPEQPETVFIWLARHGTPELRRRMIDYALDFFLTENPGKDEKPTAKGRTPKSQAKAKAKKL